MIQEIKRSKAITVSINRQLTFEKHRKEKAAKGREGRAKLTSELDAESINNQLRVSEPFKR